MCILLEFGKIYGYWLVIKGLWNLIYWLFISFICEVIVLKVGLSRCLKFMFDWLVEICEWCIEGYVYNNNDFLKLCIIVKKF